MRGVDLLRPPVDISQKNAISMGGWPFFRFRQLPSASGLNRIRWGQRMEGRIRGRLVDLTCVLPTGLFREINICPAAAAF